MRLTRSPRRPSTPLPASFAQWLGPGGTAWLVHPRSAAAAARMYLNAVLPDPDPDRAETIATFLDTVRFPAPPPTTAPPSALARYQARSIEIMESTLPAHLPGLAITEREQQQQPA